ncbi:MAG: hypothetical protein H0X29_03545 [Parachlamydiaceae bacterium]|nr:hypothetical protein [Parachlamydiaceae bacterium]
MIPSNRLRDWANYVDIELFIERVIVDQEDLSDCSGTLHRDVKGSIEERLSQVSQAIFDERALAVYTNIGNFLQVHKEEFRDTDDYSLQKLEEKVQRINACRLESTSASDNAFNKTIQIIQSLRENIKQGSYPDPIPVEIAESHNTPIFSNETSAFFNEKNFVRSLEHACHQAKNNGAGKEEIKLIVERSEKRFLKAGPDQAELIIKSLFAAINDLGITAKHAAHFGNKTANLQRLSNIFQNDPTVTVPQFHGISHEIVLEFIKLNFPLFELLCREFSDHMAIEGNSIESASSILSKIQIGIQEVISSSNSFPPQADIDFFVNMQQNIMVRSTGREDTLKVANPGGNESVANVPPNRRAISNAIGEVLASYFSARSLGQRLQSGDDIKQLPFMPILLQEMIGESNGNIPSSGVMYSTEGDLGTDGVIQISSGFGHAHGIVTGSIPTDIFYVQGNFIHGIVNDKPTRWIPGSVGLVKESNPAELKKISSLTPEEILRLVDVGAHLEDVYGLPMDIEWTLDRKTGILYLLQARPISFNEKVEPSFVTPSKIKALNIEPVTIVGAGGGKARVLNKNNTHTFQTAKDALDKYLLNPEVKPAAILIAEPTAPNSHEAGYFRERGIPLIHLSGKKYNQILGELKTHTLLLDTQEGFIAPIQMQEDPLDYITQGLRRHLAPKMESIFFQPDTESFGAFIDQLNDEAANFNDIDLKLAYGWNLLDALLNTFEEAETKSEKAYLLTSLLRTIEKRLLPKIPKNERNEIWQKIVSNAQHVWSISCADVDELNNKFAMNWLRTAILKRPTKNIIASETLYTALDAVKERQLLDLSEYEIGLENTGEHYSLKDIFQRTEKFIFLPKVRESWSTFIRNLNNEQMQQLAGVFKKFGPKVIEIWINSNFSLFWKNSPETKGLEESGQAKSVECLKMILESSETANMHSSLEIQGKALILASQFKNISLDFGEPLLYENLYRGFVETLVPKIQECITMMSLARGLELTLLTNSFNVMISAFDECLKGLSESPLYRKNNPAECELLATRFAQMLEPYCLLLYETMKTCIHDRALTVQANALLQFLPVCFNELKAQISENSLNLLLPSSNFSVAMAALGSGLGAPGRAAPKSLVDFFTLVHQSLLAASQSVGAASGLKVQNLPTQLQFLSLSLCDKLDLRNEFSRPTIQSIVYEYPNISIFYNAPLNMHSAQFIIYAKVDTNGHITAAEFEGRFFAPEGILASRGDILKRIALASYYSEKNLMYKPDNYDFAMPEKDSVHVKWAIPLSEDGILRYAEDSTFHLQKLIDSLQKFNENIEKFAIIPQVFFDHPWSLNLIKSMISVGNISKAEVAIAIDAAIKGTLENWAPNNLLAVLDIRSQLSHGRIDFSVTLIEQFLDRLITDDSLWLDTNNLVALLSFVGAMHPEIKGMNRGWPPFPEKIAQFKPLFERLSEVLRARVNALPEEIIETRYEDRFYKKYRNDLLSIF